jgi:hypothetical protein
MGIPLGRAGQEVGGIEQYSDSAGVTYRLSNALLRLNSDYTLH